MTPEDIRTTVIGMIAETFSVDADGISNTTTAEDVDGWDSLAHTVLMIRLGKRLGLSIPEAIASEARNVGALVQMLSSHLAGRPA